VGASGRGLRARAGRAGIVGVQRVAGVVQRQRLVRTRFVGSHKASRPRPRRPGRARPPTGSPRRRGPAVAHGCGEVGRQQDGDAAGANSATIPARNAAAGEPPSRSSLTTALPPSRARRGAGGAASRTGARPGEAARYLELRGAGSATLRNRPGPAVAVIRPSSALGYPGYQRKPRCSAPNGYGIRSAPMDSSRSPMVVSRGSRRPSYSRRWLR
jgi:hypothetical protein